MIQVWIFLSIIYKHGITIDFPEEVIKQAEASAGSN